MAHQTTIKELRNMQPEDLRREIRMQRNENAKLRLSITLSKEKDTAKFQRGKKQLPRMLTVLAEKERAVLPAKEQVTKVPAPVKATDDKKAKADKKAAKSISKTSTK